MFPSKTERVYEPTQSELISAVDSPLSHEIELYGNVPLLIFISISPSQLTKQVASVIVELNATSSATVRITVSLTTQPVTVSVTEAT